MFGSDWPVSGTHGTKWVDRRALNGASRTSAAACCDNAIAF
jgi:hypothetical protein